MKKILILLILLLTFSVSYSQTDTCQIDSTAYYLYYNDAINLAVDSIDSNPLHPYYDSIQLPYPLVNRILKDFSRVYDLNCPEKDSVVSLFNIHYLPPGPAMFPLIRKTVIIGFATNLNWVQQFIQDSIVSGNPSFDSLVAGHGFKLIQCSPINQLNITIRSDSYYHLRPLIEALMNIPGVSYAMELMVPGFCSESVNKIVYHATPTCDELIFSHGWDCFDCCSQRRYWKFHINPDCSAGFVSSWGNKPPIIQGQNVVSGYLRYDNTSLTPLENCTVFLIKGNDTLIQTTNSSGFFEFTGVQNGNYQLKASSSKPWGGVNSTDALKVLQHFVRFSLLSPFKQLAAEVNGNPIINSLVSLTILKRVVGITNSFVSGDWFFESTNISLLGQSITNINLKGICYGDVDGSYIPNP